MIDPATSPRERNGETLPRLAGCRFVGRSLESERGTCALLVLYAYRDEQNGQLQFGKQMSKLAGVSLGPG